MYGLFGGVAVLLILVVALVILARGELKLW